MDDLVYSLRLNSLSDMLLLKGTELLSTDYYTEDNYMLVKVDIQHLNTIEKMDFINSLKIIEYVQTVDYILYEFKGE